MSKIKNETGNNYGRLHVVEYYGKNKRKSALWRCICKCGKESIVEGTLLRSGHTKSCGCLQSEITSKNNVKYKTTHGKRNTRLYKIWTGMKDRCLNVNSNNFKNYGARNINICKEWKDDYIQFHNWSISNGYKEGLTIDRIDNDGDYEPNNCRWVSAEKQSRNKRDTIKIRYNNKEYCLAELSRVVEIPESTLRYRYHKGYRGEKLIQKRKWH